MLCCGHGLQSIDYPGQKLAEPQLLRTSSTSKSNPVSILRAAAMGCQIGPRIAGEPVDR
jgi:hypothetical protein